MDGHRPIDPQWLGKRARARAYSVFLFCLRHNQASNLRLTLNASVNPVSGMLNSDLQISRQGFSGPGIDHYGCEPGHFDRWQIS